MNAAEAAIAGLFGGNGGGGGGDVSGVKGDAEETYRTGNVNITAANVGAYTKTETDTLLNSKADTTDVDNVKISNTATGTSITLTDSADANLQAITVKGRSEEVGGEIVSVGDAKWAVVDLGTLSWARGETQTSGVYDFYSYGLSPVCISNNNTVNGLCGNYTDTTIADIYNGTAADKSIAVSNNTIRIRDDNYTDATVFKTALTGVVLYYKLADATQADPLLGVTSKNGAGQGTAATITTGLPLRSTLDGTVYDELTNKKVITRCEVVEGEVVPLATPVVTPLTSTEINAFRALRTFDGTTNISATDSPSMTVTYIKDTANGEAVKAIEDDLQGQITTLNTAKQPKTLDTPITIGGTSRATVEAALGALNTAKEDAITQSATLTLTVNGWDSTLKTQTVTFAHDTSKRNVIDITVSELGDWAACGVVAISETANGITFKCEEIPESALTFTVCSMSVTSAN